MNEMVDTSSERFAVIESRWTDRRPDRFVLAYHNEGSLRELIATPNIVAVGFTSREDAIKRIEDCFSAATPWQQAQKAIGGTVQRVLQHAVAAAVLIFYSRNAVSAFIRAFMGA